MHTFGFSDQVSQQAKTVRFVKLQIGTFYGEGGGLRHLSFTGPRRKQGTLKKCNASYYYQYKNVVAMGKPYKELINYWMESAIRSGDLRKRLASGSIGVMWTLERIVTMFRMAGHSQPAQEVR